MNDWGDVIVAAARKWEGKEFRPGVKEQCCNWVREVLSEVSHPYAARVTGQPVDGHWTGISLASSLAGRDLGQVITKFAALEPGDIVFWDDTYATGFPPGTITHIGIALGPDRFIHRNTMSAPVNVQPFAGFWRDRFRCGIRVPQQIQPDRGVKAPVESATSKLFLNGNGTSLQLRQELARGRYHIYSSGSTGDGSWLAKFVELGQGPPTADTANRIWLNPKGGTLDLRQDLQPGAFSLVSAGSEGGAWLLKLVPR